MSLDYSGPGHLAIRNFLEFLESSSLEDVQQPLGPVVIAAEPAGPPAPILIEPADGAKLSQPEVGEWRFDWEDVPSAKKYRIVVTGRTANFPILDTEIGASEYTLRRSKGSYIVGDNLRGWQWRVCAQGRNGEWGAWSELRRFDVAARR